jgi:A/G-specific adenine glycosylase
MKQFFTKQLLKWAHTVNRPMPWKGEKDAYLIWLSEIIMQQTRVEQGLPYYLKFKQKYPTVILLANAKEDEVMKLWQGLGYYSRARNLHTAAKTVKEKFKGKFPENYDEILSLKGVGDYTAAAIASFAYEMPYAVVDGNVYRVLSRYFGIKTPVDSSRAKKEFTVLANELLKFAEKPSIFNQAIMDFGALKCKPALPDCTKCPLKKNCFAFLNGKVNVFPVKEKKPKMKERFFHYIVIRDENQLLLQKRTATDIWKNMYEFPMIEAEKMISVSDLKKHKTWKKLFVNNKMKITAEVIQTTQKLTHQKINAVFYQVKTSSISVILSRNNHLIPADEKKLNNFAFPKIIDWYFQNKNLYLILNHNK